MQKLLSQLEYKKLLYGVTQLSTEKDLAGTVEKATAAIDGFVELYPLHEKLQSLLYKRGSIPYSIAQKMLDDQQEEEAKAFLLMSIKGWEALQQKFPKSSNAKKALELSGKIYIDQFDNLEKGVDLLKKANTPEAWAIVSSLKAEVLTANTPHVFKLNEQPYVDLETQNIEKVKVKVYRMDIRSYWEKSGKLKDAVKLDFDLIEPDETFEYSVKEFKKLQLKRNRLEIPFANGKPGFCVVKVESEKFESTTLVLRSNLDLAVRSSDKDIIAFVKNAKTNKPEVNAKITVASGEKIILEGVTDAKGVFYSKLKLPEGASSYRVLVNGNQGAATTAISGVYSGDPFSGSNDLFEDVEQGAEGKLKAWFLIDREEVRKGDLVKLNAVVRELNDGEYIYPKEKEFQLVVRSGNVVLMDKSVNLSKEGYLVADIRIPLATKSTSFSYSLTPKSNKKNILSGSTPFTFESEYKGTAVVSFEQDYAKEGDVLKGKVKATYRHGGPIALSKFTLGLPGGNSVNLRTDVNGEATFTYDTLADLAGSILNFSTGFDAVRVFSLIETVHLDPVDLSVSSELNKNIVTEGETLTLSCTSNNFKGEEVEAKLKVKVFFKQAGQRLDLLSGNTSVTTKLEDVEEFDLLTSATDGKVQRELTFDKVGVYYLKITATDQYGNNVQRSHTVRVLGETSSEKLAIFRESLELFDDNSAQVRVFSKLSKSTPVLLSIETHRSIERRIVTLNPGDNTVKLDLDSRYSPGFNFTIIAIDERKLFTSSLPIEVSTKLNINSSFEGVDDIGKAKAGSNVKVKLNVTDSNGKNVPSILLATLNPSHLEKLEEIKQIHSIFETSVDKTFDYFIAYS